MIKNRPGYECVRPGIYRPIGKKKHEIPPINMDEVYQELDEALANFNVPRPKFIQARRPPAIRRSEIMRAIPSPELEPCQQTTQQTTQQKSIETEPCLNKNFISSTPHPKQLNKGFFGNNLSILLSPITLENYKTMAEKSNAKRRSKDVGVTPRTSRSLENIVEHHDIRAQDSVIEIGSSESSRSSSDHKSQREILPNRSRLASELSNAHTQTKSEQKVELKPNRSKIPLRSTSKDNLKIDGSKRSLSVPARLHQNNEVGPKSGSRSFDMEQVATKSVGPEHQNKNQTVIVFSNVSRHSSARLAKTPNQSRSRQSIASKDRSRSPILSQRSLRGSRSRNSIRETSQNGNTKNLTNSRVQTSRSKSPLSSKSKRGFKQPQESLPTEPSQVINTVQRKYELRRHNRSAMCDSTDDLPTKDTNQEVALSPIETITSVVAKLRKLPSKQEYEGSSSETETELTAVKPKRRTKLAKDRERPAKKQPIKAVDEKRRNRSTSKETTKVKAHESKKDETCNKENKVKAVDTKTDKSVDNKKEAKSNNKQAVKAQANEKHIDKSLNKESVKVQTDEKNGDREIAKELTQNLIKDKTDKNKSKKETLDRGDKNKYVQEHQDSSCSISPLFLLEEEPLQRATAVQNPTVQTCCDVGCSPINFSDLDRESQKTNACPTPKSTHSVAKEPMSDLDLPKTANGSEVRSPEVTVQRCSVALSPMPQCYKQTLEEDKEVQTSYLEVIQAKRRAISNMKPINSPNRASNSVAPPPLESESSSSHDCTRFFQRSKMYKSPNIFDSVEQGDPIEELADFSDSLQLLSNPYPPWRFSNDVCRNSLPAVDFSKFTISRYLPQVSTNQLADQDKPPIEEEPQVYQLETDPLNIRPHKNYGHQKSAGKATQAPFEQFNSHRVDKNNREQQTERDLEPACPIASKIPQPMSTEDNSETEDADDKDDDDSDQESLPGRSENNVPFTFDSRCEIALEALGRKRKITDFCCQGRPHVDREAKGSNNVGQDFIAADARNFFNQGRPHVDEGARGSNNVGQDFIAADARNFFNQGLPHVDEGARGSNNVGQDFIAADARNVFNQGRPHVDGRAKVSNNVDQDFIAADARNFFNFEEAFKNVENPQNYEIETIDVMYRRKSKPSVVAPKPSLSNLDSKKREDKRRELDALFGIGAGTNKDVSTNTSGGLPQDQTPAQSQSAATKGYTQKPVGPVGPPALPARTSPVNEMVIDDSVFLPSVQNNSPLRHVRNSDKKSPLIRSPSSEAPPWKPGGKRQESPKQLRKRPDKSNSPNKTRSSMRNNMPKVIVASPKATGGALVKTIIDSEKKACNTDETNRSLAHANVSSTENRLAMPVSSRVVTVNRVQVQEGASSVQKPDEVLSDKKVQKVGNKLFASSTRPQPESVLMSPPYSLIAVETNTTKKSTISAARNHTRNQSGSRERVLMSPVRTSVAKTANKTVSTSKSRIHSKDRTMLSPVMTNKENNSTVQTRSKTQTESRNKSPASPVRSYKANKENLSISPVRQSRMTETRSPASPVKTKSQDRTSKKTISKSPPPPQETSRLKKTRNVASSVVSADSPESERAIQDNVVSTSNIQEESFKVPKKNTKKRAATIIQQDFDDTVSSSSRSKRCRKPPVNVFMHLFANQPWVLESLKQNDCNAPFARKKRLTQSKKANSSTASLKKSKDLTSNSRKQSPNKQIKSKINTTRQPNQTQELETVSEERSHSGPSQPATEPHSDSVSEEEVANLDLNPAKKVVEKKTGRARGRPKKKTASSETQSDKRNEDQNLPENDILIHRIDILPRLASEPELHGRGQGRPKKKTASSETESSDKRNEDQSLPENNILIHRIDILPRLASEPVLHEQNELLEDQELELPIHFPTGSQSVQSANKIMPPPPKRLTGRPKKSSLLSRDKTLRKVVSENAIERRTRSNSITLHTQPTENRTTQETTNTSTSNKENELPNMPSTSSGYESHMTNNDNHTLARSTMSQLQIEMTNRRYVSNTFELPLKSRPDEQHDTSYWEMNETMQYSTDGISSGFITIRSGVTKRFHIRHQSMVYKIEKGEVIVRIGENDELLLNDSGGHVIVSAGKEHTIENREKRDVKLFFVKIERYQ